MTRDLPTDLLVSPLTDKTGTFSPEQAMTIEDPDSNPASDIVDWLGDSVPFNIQSFLTDPYSSEEINSYPWWDHNQDFLSSSTFNASCFDGNSTPEATTTTSLISSDPISHDCAQPSDLLKKRKLSEEQAPITTSQNQQQKKNQNRKTVEGDDNKATVAEASTTRKSVGNKKGSNRSGGSNGNNGNNNDGRWAEQLLNPCASALIAGNMTRVQHLLYVLHELASPTGDANHRLAAHGLRALSHRLSTSPSSVSAGPITFASTEPKFFQRSLLKFYEVSPWFAFHNNIANSSILQILAQGSDSNKNPNLHILDIGVSHGVQWPTLLEALTRRPGGPPPQVRITVIAPTEAIHQTVEPPFSIGPPGDNFYSKLPGFAKTLNINLQIQRLDNHPLQNLNPQFINNSARETLIICAQFRLHHLSHSNPDERSELLRLLRRLGPKGVILSENNMDCSCRNCGDFAMGFSRRVEYLWRFLDSTSSAFKGRESEERRVMEGEAAKALTNPGEMNEAKEKWCERMKEAGFSGEGFGEDAIDGGRALLRKYDSNWEMRTDERDGCVGFWWKSQPVSFCSLWRPDCEDMKSL